MVRSESTAICQCQNLHTVPSLKHLQAVEEHRAGEQGSGHMGACPRHRALLGTALGRATQACTVTETVDGSQRLTPQHPGNTSLLCPAIQLKLLKYLCDKTFTLAMFPHFKKVFKGIITGETSTIQIRKASSPLCSI